MFVGVTDNTATTLEWAMAELVKNPSEMRKVQAEVRRVVGKKSKVEENDVNQMEYLKCVVKETMRLHVPAMITRATIASTSYKGTMFHRKQLCLSTPGQFKGIPNCGTGLKSLSLRGFLIVLLILRANTVNSFHLELGEGAVLGFH